MNKIKYTPDIVEFLRNNYVSKGVRYCQEILGEEFSILSIVNKCNALGIRSKRRNVFNKTFNINDFTNVTNPILVYYLGLLWADGSVNFSSARLQNVEEDARYFYDTIKSLGGFRTYLNIPKNGIDKDQFIVTMNHTEICEYLMSMDYGVKSLVSPTKILSTIPDNLKHLFWLGFFDGDGNCYQHPRNRRQGKTAFCGSYEQDWTDLEKLLQGLGIRYKIDRTINKKGQKGSTVTSYCLYEICKLEKYFYPDYENTKIGLFRKYEKFQLIKSNTGRKLESALNLAGVSKTVSGKFKMFIREKNEKYSGLFLTIEEAATAYDIFAVEFRGEYAKTNYPIRNYTIEYLLSLPAKTLKRQITKAIPRK